MIDWSGWNLEPPIALLTRSDGPNSRKDGVFELLPEHQLLANKWKLVVKWVGDLLTFWSTLTFNDAGPT